MAASIGDFFVKKMMLNKGGEIIKNHWLKLPERFPNINLDEFIIMPNHFHGIINVGATLVVAHSNVWQKPMNERATTRVAPTIGNIIGAFKSLTMNEYAYYVKSGELPSFEKSIWQRNYHEHIIRGDEDLNRIREYIMYNPINWKNDELFFHN